MATLSVEVEVTAATFNGTDSVACTLVYRLINEANQNVLATKSVNVNLVSTGEVLDPSDVMRMQVDAAVQWGQWLVAANKAGTFVGKKQRVAIA